MDNFKKSLIILFSLISPWWVYFYYKQLRSAFVFTLVVLTITGLFSVTRILTSFDGFITWLVLISLIHVAGVWQVMTQNILCYIAPGKGFLYVLISLLILFLFIKAFPFLTGMSLYYIPSQSMQPTLKPGHYIMVDKWIYKEQQPKQSDIIVYCREKCFVKRIIAIPNDQISLRKAKILVNNYPIAEYNRIEKIHTFFLQNTVIPDNRYYVMGDNRGISVDSRHFGTIDIDEVVGKFNYTLN